ncbi:MAG: hypothetical protein MZV49_06470 [Rhodopseudomonas palustris]|nr:hypothetical protein [Rhodopseudomonas palustris]
MARDLAAFKNAGRPPASASPQDATFAGQADLDGAPKLASPQATCTIARS